MNPDVPTWWTKQGQYLWMPTIFVVSETGKMLVCAASSTNFFWGGTMYGVNLKVCTASTALFIFATNFWQVFRGEIIFSLFGRIFFVGCDHHDRRECLPCDRCIFFMMPHINYKSVADCEWFMSRAIVRELQWQPHPFPKWSSWNSTSNVRCSLPARFWEPSRRGLIPDFIFSQPGVCRLAGPFPFVAFAARIRFGRPGQGAGNCCHPSRLLKYFLLAAMHTFPLQPVLFNFQTMQLPQLCCHDHGFDPPRDWIVFGLQPIFPGWCEVLVWCFVLNFLRWDLAHFWPCFVPLF